MVVTMFALMGLKDRLNDGRSRISEGGSRIKDGASRVTGEASRLAGEAATKAKETVAGSEAGARLLSIVRMDDDKPLSVERLLVMLVDAVRGDDGEEERDLTDKDVLKAAKRRQRMAGAAGALGGPAGLQLASLYCEVELLCDVAERHRLQLADEELAAHMLVLWNAMPDVVSACAAIDGSGQSVVARAATTAHGKVVTKPHGETTKKDVVKTIWRLRGAVGDIEMPGSSSPMNVLLPGRRVKAFTLQAEEQLDVIEPIEKRGRFLQRND